MRFGFSYPESSAKLNMKVLFIVPYSVDYAPSQRFRFEQYFTLLIKYGHEVSVAPFQSQQHWQVFYQPGQAIKKALLIFTGSMRRVGLLFSVHCFTHVFIHREALPIGPPWFEWLLAKVWQKKLIYDFDDAIWMTDKKSENGLEKLLKWRGKVSTICHISHCVSCGNAYLAAYAQQFNARVVINPTTIDTEFVHNPFLWPSRITQTNVITIGWTGSRTTLKYLQPFLPVFYQLQQRFQNIRFLIIADQNPGFENPAIEFKEWGLETEIRDLAQIDIGIMPLPDDEWSKGKCGFKLLQYMALGIPCVASAVGENRVIVNGKNGRLATDENSWIAQLSELISDPGLRKEMGVIGRSFVIDHYSVKSNSENFLSLFE